MLNPTTVDGILNTADRLGANIPKPVLTKWRKLTATRTSVKSLDTTSDLPGAVLAAVEKGVDPTTDPGVQRAVTARAIGDVRNEFNKVLNDRVEDFARTHAHDILAGFQKPFDAAALSIARCLDTLSDVALEDTEAALSRGGSAAAAWVDAQEADKTISTIQQTWKLLNLVAPTGLSNPRHQLLIISPVPPATFIDENLDKTSTRPWDVARRGWRLSLATPETLQERVNAIAEEHQKRVTRADNAFGEQFKRTHGVAVS